MPVPGWCEYSPKHTLLRRSPLRRCFAASHKSALLCSIILLHLWAASAPTTASVQVGPGSLTGLGGLGSPITGNTDAMDWNPAALGETRHMLQFSVIPLSAELSSDDWAVDKVFNGLSGHLSADEQQALLAGVEGGSVTTSLRLRGGAQGAIGGNGAGASVRLHVNTTMNPDAARLLLEGGQPGGVYNIAGSSIETAALGDYHISSVYSDPWLADVLHIGGFHMGGSLRVLQGLEYLQARASDSTFSVVETPEGYSKEGGGDFQALRSQKGWGIATDLGLLLRLTPNVAVDVSLLDFGRVWWGDVHRANLTFAVDPLTGLGRYELAGQTPVDRILPWSLPTTIRAGFSVISGPYVSWTLQYAKQLAGEHKDKVQWVLGTQLNRFKELPLRMSAKYDEATQNLSFSLGIGIELGPLTVDIATTDLGSLVGGSKDAKAAISTGLRF